jgi:uncharacterized protein YggE
MRKCIHWSIGLGTLLCALALIWPLVPTSVSAQGGSSYTITVTGSGTASAKPDLVSCDISIEAIDSDQVLAYDNVTAKLESVRTGLEGLGIDPADLQLLRVVVIPEDRTDSGAAPTGEFLFRARGVFQVVIRTPENLEDVLSAALQAGANTIDNFTYGFQSIDEIEQTARAAAIRNAYARAEQLASEMSVAVGEPIIINEVSAGLDFSSLPDVTISPYPLDAGELVVRVEVNITFALRSTR